MDEPAQSIWKRELLPPFLIRWRRRLGHWLFSWRGARRVLIVLVWTATILGLIYGEENWRGRHAWNKYRRELEARGEQLNWQAFIPKPVPDDQNFAATPAVQSWFPYKTDDWVQTDNYARAGLVIREPDPVKRDLGNRHFMDLVAWKMAFEYAASQKTMKQPVLPEFATDKLDRESRAGAAPGVLAGLKTNETLLAELRRASARPQARYPVVYDLKDPWGILIPHLAMLKAACLRLQLQSCAELAAGRSDAALDDVKLMLYLADSINDEPFLVSYLERSACVHIAMQPVWEGLAEHAWADTQLQTLQTRLQQYDFIGDLKWSLAAERAAGILTVELIRKKGAGYLVDIGGGGQPTMFDRDVATFAGHIVPGGWYYLEELNYCRLFQLQFDETFDPIRKSVSPDRIQTNLAEIQREIPDGPWRKSFLQHKAIAALMLPAPAQVPRRAAMAQTAVNQAAVACALERYRLANGQFPENLQALAPQFITSLPHDVIGGGPYHYHRTADGRFVLYSVGWNQQDDGGKPGRTLFDEKDGDWVWQYPQ